MGCIKSKEQVETRSLILSMVGLPGSGKSTLAKQLKLIQVGPNAFSTEELENFAEETRYNLFNGVQSLVKNIKKKDAKLKRIKNSENRKYAEEFTALSFPDYKEILGEEMANHLIKLWNDKGIKEWVAEYGVEEYERESQLTYVMSQLPRILMPNYLPTEDDCIRARQRTTGLSIVEYTTRDPKMNWKLIDMGGQKSERRKWQFGLRGSTGVIFCIALDEFDRESETEGVSVIEEATDLFKQVATTSLQEGDDKTVFLFLNKKDLFFIKLRKMEKTFKDYKGGKDYSAALEYIKDKFLSKLDDRIKKKIHVHESCALDKGNVKKIFDRVMRTVHENSLQASGLIDKDQAYLATNNIEM